MSSFLDKQPQYTEWSADKAIKEGYKASVYVYACVRLLSRQSSSVPWVVYKKQRGENSKKWVEVEDHPLAVLLRKPNPYFSGQDLMESLIIFLHLTGFAPWWIVPVRDLPGELWMLQPQKVRPVPSKEEYLAYWEYDVDGRLYQLPPNQVVAHKFFNPANEYLGLAPLQAGAKEVDVYNEGMDWNKVAMQNRAVTDGAFVTKEKIFDDAEYQQLKRWIKEQYSGKTVAREPWVLSNVDWVKMALTPVEMDYIETLQVTREAICIAFGVPPVLVGIQDKSTYNNYNTALKQLWLDNIIPLLIDIRETMALQLVPWYGTEYYLDYDVSKVPALQAMLAEKIDAAQKIWTMGVSFNAVNKKLDLGFDPIPGGDVGYLPASILPAGEMPVSGSLLEENEQKKTGFPAIRL